MPTHAHTPQTCTAAFASCRSRAMTCFERWISASRFCECIWKKIAQVSSTVIFCSKWSSELTFENFYLYLTSYSAKASRIVVLHVFPTFVLCGITSPYPKCSEIYGSFCERTLRRVGLFMQKSFVIEDSFRERAYDKSRARAHCAVSNIRKSNIKEFLYVYNIYTYTYMYIHIQIYMCMNIYV